LTVPDLSAGIYLINLLFFCYSFIAGSSRTALIRQLPPLSTPFGSAHRRSRC